MLAIKNFFVLFFFVLISWFTLAQNTENILSTYVEQGLNTNLIIQQRHIAIDQALLSLRRAKSHYLPMIDFNALYSDAQGGRKIELPVGDMLNPVYSMLNAFIGSPVFPQIENQSVNFLPHNYYDARFRLTLPIIHTDRLHNIHIQNKQVFLQENELAIYKRELIKEIKIAYFQYVQLAKSIEIYQQAINLAQENKRHNEKLLEAGSGLHAYILRSESEISQATAQLKATQWKQKTLQYYFNALLNRPAEEQIEITEEQQIIPLLSDSKLSSENREERASIDLVIAIREDVVKMKRHQYYPKLNGFADLGSQAEDLRFDKNSGYFMVGLQLSIPVFNGTRNLLNIKEAKYDLEQTKLQKEQIIQQLDVQIQAVYHEVLTCKEQYEASLTQLELAESYFRLINNSYTQGMSSYLETLEARTQLNTARISTNILYYQLLIALAKIERETGE